jgi:hypothetical protein
MNEGNVLAANISAIPLDQWKPGSLPLLFDDGVYGYYETKSGEKPLIPVAYNQGRKKLSPISSIVHVLGIDESTRAQLKAAGYEEYYYFKNIQRLSLRTSPAQVVEVYEGLARQGLNVKLEVIQEIPVAH